MSEIVVNAENDIQSLEFSPNSSDILSTTSWNGRLNIWQLNGNQLVSSVTIQQTVPNFCHAWALNGSMIYAGGADGAVSVVDPQTQQIQALADRHTNAIKVLKLVGDQGFLTGSWDKSMKLWDSRNGSNMSSISLPERVYAADVNNFNVVCATANRHVLVYDLRNALQPLSQTLSILKFQTRAVGWLPDGDSYAIGSIAGRVGICNYKTNDNLIRKVHRDDCKHKVGTNKIYSCNSISVHPKGMVAACGSNGLVDFFDYKSKIRGKDFPFLKNNDGSPLPITASAFSKDGLRFAYATGDDFSNGPDTNIQCIKSLHLFAIQPQDLQKQQPTGQPQGQGMAPGGMAGGGAMGGGMGGARPGGLATGGWR